MKTFEIMPARSREYCCHISALSSPAIENETIFFCPFLIFDYRCYKNSSIRDLLSYIRAPFSLYLFVCFSIFLLPLFSLANLLSLFIAFLVPAEGTVFVFHILQERNY